MDEDFDTVVRAEIQGIMTKVDNVVKKLEEAGYGKCGESASEAADSSGPES